MATEVKDPRMTAIHPRIRYNTIGGVNGPLVILDNVSNYQKFCHGERWDIYRSLGQISAIQRDRLVDPARWLREVWTSVGGSRCYLQLETYNVCYR